MKQSQEQKRILRLERVLLALVALMSGEAQKVGTQDEVEGMTAALAIDCQTMRDDLLMEEW